MNRRMFFASVAGFAAVSRMSAAGSGVRSTLAPLPAVDATEPLPEWDYTAEDFDAFQARTTGEEGRGRLASGAAVRQ